LTILRLDEGSAARHFFAYGLFRYPSIRMVALHRFNLMIILLRQWGCLSPRRLASCLIHDPRIIVRRPAYLGQSGRVGTITTHASAVDRRQAASGGTAEEDTTERKSSTTTTRLISFFTDIEGDRDYLQRFVEQSKVLCWRNNTHTNTNDEDDGDDRMTMKIDFREPHGHDMAVFGGDIWDQGGHDLWCLRQLLDLRRRYPDRFYCILGNRDVNKMRLAYELHNSAEEYPPRGVFFKGDKPKPTFATRGERLRHILQATMGSPRAFEYRRQELQEQLQLSGVGEGQETIVTDDDVVDSYRDQCDPETGALIDYIERSALLLQFGQVAFLHGALPVAQINTDNNKSCWKDLTVVMPWLPPGVSAPDVGVHTIGDWIQALGAFVRSEVAAFRRHGKSYAWIEHGGYQGLCGGLIQYGMGMLPGRLVNPTIIYNRWGPRSFADDTEPRQFWDEAQTSATQEFFRQSGIKVICCGPRGKCPIRFGWTWTANRTGSSPATRAIRVTLSTMPNIMLTGPIPVGNNPRVAGVGAPCRKY
jgi:hypothetical protein